jgi:hypothetical protein
LAKHDGFSAEERGRRVRWRATSIGLFAALIVAGYRLADQERWPANFAPMVGLPYWALVTVIWRRWGPYMAALHGNFDRRRPRDE